MKKITSKIVGEFKQDERFEDWWQSDSLIEIPMFGLNKTSVIFTGLEPETDVGFIDSADIALENFLNLDSDYKLEISNYAFQNFKEFASMVGEDDIPVQMKNLKSHSEIWDFVTPMCTYLSRRPYKDKDVYVNLVCRCEWEKEHGLQLVFRQGKKLTRVSQEDGHLTEADAYGKPDSQDFLLSMF